MVVSGEECAAAQPRRVVQVLNHRLRNGDTVIRRCPPPHLVEDQQGCARGVVEDERGLRHLDHEGRHPRGDVVMCAHAREDAIRQPDDRLLCRHEASALGQQHNERALAQVCRLACHVGPGEDGDLLHVRVELQVVGNKHSGRQALLHQRVTATLDLEAQPRIDVRAAPPKLGCAECQAEDRVDDADRLGYSTQRGGGGRDALAELTDDLLLTRGHPVASAQHDRLSFLELRGQVTLGARERLLAYVVGGNRGGAAMADLDVVAENLVVSDLQGSDSSALALPGFEPGYPVPRAA